MNQSETTSAAGGGETYPTGTAQRLIQRLEDATAGSSMFGCRADYEEAVEIAAEEITAALAAPTAKGNRGATQDAVKIGNVEGEFFGGLHAQYPAPTQADLADPQFNAVWQVIKHWDVNVHGAYNGYCGAMGNHVMAVLNAVRSVLQSPEDAALAASPPPPAGAAGGSGVMSARLIPWEPGQQGVEITLTGGRSVAIPLSQSAGAAGGGSGDLAALSAGAAKGPWFVCGDEGHPSCNPQWYDGRTFGSATEGKRIGDVFPLCEEPEANAAFIVALVNAYRSGRLIEAPTPDLGAQGEPVAQGTLADEPYDPLKAAIWQALTPFMVEMMQTGGVTFMGVRNAVVAAVRPLYEAPAASRPGSGVSAEEIARTIADELGFFYDPTNVEEAEADDPKPEDYLRVARAILALIAQAPRDGGETQGGWQPIETAPKDGTWFLGWQADSAQYGGKPANVVRWVDRIGWTLWDYEGLKDPTHWRPLPTPPSGVETIRQGGEQ